MRRRFSSLAIVLIVGFILMSVPADGEKYEPEDATPLWTDRYGDKLVSELRKAEKSIFILQYLVMGRGYVPQVRNILDVLKTKSRNGVNVRIIADGSREGEYGNPINSMLNTSLDTGSARVTVLSPEQVMHSKVVVIDTTVSFIGSQNWTKSGLSENVELAAFVRDESFSRDLLEQLRLSLQERLGQARLRPGEKSINDVTRKELKALPIIGRFYAEKIIDFRRRKGLIRRIDQLDKISGIGNKRMKVLRDYFGESARQEYKKIHGDDSTSDG